MGSPDERMHAPRIHPPAITTGIVLCALLFWSASGKSPSGTAAEDAAPQAADSSTGAPEEVPITDSDRAHWSFSPLDRPELPAVQNTAWPRNDIDHFVLAELERKGLSPQPEADRRTLIRRLSFDLIGLPPSPAAVERFVNDTRPDAYERLVDDLLASPRYGERWAQHWLDLARFAETDGFEHDKVRPDAWRYRDWVIQAWNDDLPYDEFLTLQLAGDELGEALPTAFCLSGPDMPDINSQVERRHVLLDEMAGTVGSVVLALQLGCARCHDHMYDPISQLDFFRWRAFFGPAVAVEKNQSVHVLQPDVSDEPSRLLVRGDWTRPGVEVAPSFLRIVNPAEATVSLEDGAAATRLQLADWLTRSDHPLTSRVMANRIWQHHFGFGLSRTSSDFGVMGEEPSHPELLDWLATEWMANGWSCKSLHRRIVCSATYRQAGRAPTESPRAAWEASLERDPHGIWLSRFPRRRLEGEAVRDALLVAAGRLNDEMGGPGVRPPLPPELVRVLLHRQWEVTPDSTAHDRRSIYVFARRNLRYPIFEAFDRPAANSSCPRRPRSTTAPQALHLLNSDFVMECAFDLAARLERECDSDSDRVAQAVQILFGRPPQPEELPFLLSFLGEQESATVEGTSRETAALADLCLALINANEFLYVD